MVKIKSVKFFEVDGKVSSCYKSKVKGKRSKSRKPCTFVRGRLRSFMIFHKKKEKLAT